MESNSGKFQESDTNGFGAAYNPLLYSFCFIIAYTKDLAQISIKYHEEPDDHDIYIYIF